MVASTIDELAKDYADKIVFGKLNVDENPKTTMQFDIMSIPTLLINEKWGRSRQNHGGCSKTIHTCKTTQTCVRRASSVSNGDSHTFNIVYRI
jgi:thiol-disulfide isomerase/thioredoxin